MGYIGGKTIGREFSACQSMLRYGLTARSNVNRKIKEETIKLTSNIEVPALYVRSLEPLSPEDSAILEYPCITGPIPIKKGTDAFVIGNGIQDLDIAMAIANGELKENHSSDIVRKWLDKHGVEPDGKTPRIAGIALADRSYFDSFSFGTIYPDKDGKSQAPKCVPGTISMAHVTPHVGEFQGIATYTGEIWDLVAARMPRTVPVAELSVLATAQDYADKYYEELEEFFVIKDDGTKVDTRVSTAVRKLNWAGYTTGIHNRRES